MMNWEAVKSVLLILILVVELNHIKFHRNQDKILKRHWEVINRFNNNWKIDFELWERQHKINFETLKGCEKSGVSGEIIEKLKELNLGNLRENLAKDKD